MTDAAMTPTEALDKAKDTMNAAENRASGKVVQLRARVQEGADALNDWAQGQARAIATTAKQKPLAAAGISAGAAFGMGLLLGLLIARAAPPAEPTWKDRLLELKPNW